MIQVLRKKLVNSINCALGSLFGVDGDLRWRIDIGLRYKKRLDWRFIQLRWKFWFRLLHDLWWRQLLLLINRLFECHLEVS